MGSVLYGGRNAPTPLWLTQTLPPSPVQVLLGAGMLAAARDSQDVPLLWTPGCLPGSVSELLGGSGDAKTGEGPDFPQG